MARCVRYPESKRLGRFQQLDHALEQSPRAAAVEAAMIEAQGDFGLRDGNELGFSSSQRGVFFPAPRPSNSV